MNGTVNDCQYSNQTDGEMERDVDIESTGRYILPSKIRQEQSAYRSRRYTYASSLSSTTNDTKILDSIPSPSLYNPTSLHVSYLHGHSLSPSSDSDTSVSSSGDSDSDSLYDDRYMVTTDGDTDSSASGCDVHNISSASYEYKSLDLFDKLNIGNEKNENSKKQLSALYRDEKFDENANVTERDIIPPRSASISINIKRQYKRSPSVGTLKHKFRKDDTAADTDQRHAVWLSSNHDSKVYNRDVYDNQYQPKVENFKVDCYGADKHQQDNLWEILGF